MLGVTISAFIVHARAPRLSPYERVHLLVTMLTIMISLYLRTWIVMSMKQSPSMEGTPEYNQAQLTPSALQIIKMKVKFPVLNDLQCTMIYILKFPERLKSLIGQSSEMIAGVIVKNSNIVMIAGL